MPYQPSSSYNYSFSDPFGGQFGQIANRGFDLAQTGMDRGFGLAEKRLGLTEDQQRWLQQFQTEQANRGFGLERDRFGLETTQAERAYGLQRDQFGLTKSQQDFANAAAIREENWAKSLSNPAVRAAMRGPEEPPDVQLYRAQLAEAERAKKERLERYSAAGWGYWNKYM
jgi:hypothetical protein